MKDKWKSFMRRFF